MIQRVIAAFKEISCFGLRVKFTDQGELVRANYLPTLSGFRFTRMDKGKSDKCVHEFGESSPPHMRNIFSASLMQQLIG